LVVEAENWNSEEEDFENLALDKEPLQKAYLVVEAESWNLEEEDFENLALDKEPFRKTYLVVEVDRWHLEEEDIVEQNIKVAFDKDYLMRPLS
jgi:hypothetical protein